MRPIPCSSQAARGRRRGGSASSCRCWPAPPWRSGWRGCSSRPIRTPTPRPRTGPTWCPCGTWRACFGSSSHSTDSPRAEPRPAGSRSGCASLEMTMAGSRAFIWILAVSGFASTFSGRAVEPMVGVIARDLSARPETVALLAAAFALPYAFIQPILGPIGDAVGKERVMKICLLVLVLALMGSVVAPNAAILFGLRMVAGAAAGGVVPLSLALIGDRVAMAGRQVAISRFLIAIITGQLAGSSLAGLLAAFVGWRGVFVASTAMLTVAFVATGGGFRKAPSAGGFEPRDALARYAGIIANPRARTLFLLVFVEAITVFGLFPYVAPLLEERGEGGPAEAGLVLAGFAIGGLVYSALVGWMLRRLGLRRMLRGGGMIAGSALLILGVAVDWR